MKNTMHWFRIRKSDRGIETFGTPSCSLGHKINRGEDDIPDGIFAEWDWDGRRLLARTDYYGMSPIFYYAGDNEVTLSTSLVRLIAEGAPTDLDYPALAAFIRLSAFVGDDTPFKSIRMLPPNGTLRWEDGTLAVSGEVPIVKEQTLTQDQAIDGVIEFFAQAVARRHPVSERTAVPLSGGHDSRHLLLELHKQNVKPALCVTVEQDDEADIARLLADKLEIPQKILKLDGFWFRNELRKEVLSNFASAELVEFMCLADFLNHHGIENFYDGIGGDMLMEGPSLKVTEARAEDDRSPEEIAEAYFNFYGPKEDAVMRLLGEAEYPSMNRDVAKERFLKEWAVHATGHNPHTSFFFWARTRRHAGMSAYGLFSCVDKVFSPFLDRDFFEFASSLPTAIVFSWVLQESAMKRAYPEYANIPFSTESRDGTSPLGQRIINLWDQVWFILRRNPRQLRRLVSGLTSRFGNKSWVRPSFFHYMILLDTLRKPGGASHILELSAKHARQTKHEDGLS